MLLRPRPPLRRAFGLSLRSSSDDDDNETSRIAELDLFRGRDCDFEESLKRKRKKGWVHGQFARYGLRAFHRKAPDAQFGAISIYLAREYELVLLPLPARFMLPRA